MLLGRCGRHRNAVLIDSMAGEPVVRDLQMPCDLRHVLGPDRLADQDLTNSTLGDADRARQVPLRPTSLRKRFP